MFPAVVRMVMDLMIVVILSKCPKSLRGDLSKWLIEVDKQAYVGKVTSRIKDHLWERIISSVSSGKAIMIHESYNEQRFEFLMYNTDKSVTDFDGLQLVSSKINSKETE